MNDEPVLFDVGIIALSHAETPVSDRALDYVKQAIRGDLDAVVPYTAVIGAHLVLRSAYRFPREKATNFLTNFLGAKRIYWYGGLEESDARSALAIAGEHNIGPWDGYYARVARETGATTILTLDDDFERVDGLTTKVVLSDSEFEALNDYIESLAG